MLRPSHHGLNEIAVVEIDLERQPSKIGGGELEGCLRQVNAVIVADLGSGQRSLHQTGVAAGDVEEAEGRFETIVQGCSKDTPDFAVGQDTAFDQLAVRAPLFLELGQRGGVHPTPPG